MVTEIIEDGVDLTDFCHCKKPDIKEDSICVKCGGIIKDENN
jgi:hypothetical protein